MSEEVFYMAIVKRMGASEARNRLSHLMDEAYYNHAKFVLERRGLPMALVIGIEEYQKWQEDKEDIEDMIEALTSSEGKWINFEDYHEKRLARVQSKIQKPKGREGIGSNT
jgi:prevent-host-death family protein